jgi:Mce-associated membrane protein
VTLTELTPRVATPDDDTTVSEDGAAAALASWPSRAGALAIDLIPGGVVLTVAALVALSVPLRGGWWWISVGLAVAAVLWTAVNRVLLPSTCGHSLGRNMFGIAVVRRDGTPVGSMTLLWRDIAHLLDTAPALLGWLWPLKDSRHRTFADVMAGTEVHMVSTGGANRRSRRRTGIAVLIAAALCAAGAVTSVTVVARHAAAATDTRAAITAQGPHIVEEILSYHPDTLQTDFDRAQSLVTDAYRAQLTAQQQALRKAGAVRNEYWTTNSAVLAADRGRATMLVFLQGQRGADPNQRYLTASVRVDFVQSGSAPWRVDDLTVVNSPTSVKATP